MNVRIRIDGQEMSGDHWLRGRLYHDGHATADAGALCAGWRGMDAWAAGLRRTNGFFALVHRQGAEVFAAVDHIRSIPLFFATAGDEAYLSDDARWVRDQLGAGEGQGPAATDFLLAGYVTGNETLVPGLSQLSSGDMVRLAPGPGGMTAEVRRYWSYADTQAPPAPREELEERFDAMLLSTFGRLVEMAAGRTIVVPLSGGNDSRLLLTMLKRMGYPRLVTFTYGREGNEESVLSREVARMLGVPWHFVPYDNASWRRWFLSEERKAYYAMADGLSSLPLLLDWPAVGELRRRGIVPDDAVFAPGLTADVYAGSRSTRYPHLYRPGLPPVDEVVHVVLRSCVALWDWSRREEEWYPVLAQRVLSGLGDYARFDDGGRALEAWEARERQPKYIVNSVRAYEFWGYDWWIPFWDKEFLDFWPNVPPDLRMDRVFYRGFVERLFARVSGVPQRQQPPTAGKAWLGPAVKRMVLRSPLYPVVRSGYRMVRSVTEYDRHPAAYYGMVPRDVFLRTAG
ncbi:MAG TPA: asparagine synthetase B family protein, partial [Longimicrobium sp.]|nr:asparagine synthetase B family protein [Longimicrobium sp.]